MYTVHARHLAQNLRLRFEKSTLTEALRTAAHLLETGWTVDIDGPRRFRLRELKAPGGSTSLSPSSP